MIFNGGYPRGIRQRYNLQVDTDIEESEGSITLVKQHSATL